ncbi:MAG: SIS domain-containing protein [Patescibacteria group bacterium]
MMYDAIASFNEQLGFEPVVHNGDKLKPGRKFLVTGMGGSHLAADLIGSVGLPIELTVHKNYGLPKGDLSDYLVIASSYSGNTEEAIDGLQTALDQNLKVAVMSVGGALLEIAKKHGLPYVQMPDTGIQPRSALGYSLMSMLKLMGLKKELSELAVLGPKLTPKTHEKQGKELAAQLAGSVPLIYSSTENQAVAYNWKIKLNETGKIPAFYNVLPELNHNEMTGFDVVAATQKLSANIQCIFLSDSNDHPQIKKRMAVLEKLYRARGLAVVNIPLQGTSRWERILRSIILADWFSYYTAEHYGVEAEQVPMVEQFKQLIS